MRIQWRKEALEDLDRFHVWLSSIESAQPDRTILRIRSAVEAMARLGDIGRPGRNPGTRELSVRIEPYVVAYAVYDDVIDVLAVYHTAQDQ